MDQVQEILKQAESFFNGFIDTGSKYVAEGIATGLGTANDALKQAKGFASAELSWVAEEAQKAEAIALDYTHQGVAIAAKYPEYTQAAGRSSLLLPLLRPRFSLPSFLLPIPTPRLSLHHQQRHIPCLHTVEEI